VKNYHEEHEEHEVERLYPLRQSSGKAPGAAFAHRRRNLPRRQKGPFTAPV